MKITRRSLFGLLAGTPFIGAALAKSLPESIDATNTYSPITADLSDMIYRVGPTEYPFPVEIYESDFGALTVVKSTLRNRQKAGM